MTGSPSGIAHMIAASIPVGTASDNAKEQIKMVGFLLFDADFRPKSCAFNSYAPRVR